MGGVNLYKGDRYMDATEAWFSTNLSDNVPIMGSQLLYNPGNHTNPLLMGIESDLASELNWIIKQHLFAVANEQILLKFLAHNFFYLSLPGVVIL